MAEQRHAGAEAPSTSVPLEGPAAPPRRNGELIFAEPWQARLFGVTLDLVERGVLQWSDFQQQLIASLEIWEEHGTADRATDAESEGWSEERYYQCWLSALEHLLGRTLLDPHLVLARREALRAARAHEHEH